MCIRDRYFKSVNKNVVINGLSLDNTKRFLLINAAYEREAIKLNITENIAVLKRLSEFSYTGRED